MARPKSVNKPRNENCEDLKSIDALATALCGALNTMGDLREKIERLTKQRTTDCRRFWKRIDLAEQEIAKYRAIELRRKAKSQPQSLTKTKRKTR